MLIRLRQIALLLLAASVGYELGRGPFAEWVADVYNEFRVIWAAERISRGHNGTLPLLIAGFLIGQGLFLTLRTVVRQIGPWQAIRTERVAAWDASLKLATRFGLHQYLEHCGRWAIEDPTARTQCLALFKIRGLGVLNEISGTLATTELLQQISAELRAASLPDSASYVKRWQTHHLPRAVVAGASGVPAPRYPARWSGATFALAFRELDAVQAVAIARDLCNWIRKELNVFAGESRLSLCAAVAVGGPGVTGRSLSRVAAEAVNAENDKS